MNCCSGSFSWTARVHWLLHGNQWLTMNHLSDHTRMPDADVVIFARTASASSEDRPFANIALDECMEMFRRIINQVLHRITPGYIRQLVSIVENRKIARDEVKHRFYKPRKARNTVKTLVKDRRRNTVKKGWIRHRISPGLWYGISQKRSCDFH